MVYGLSITLTVLLNLKANFNLQKPNEACGNTTFMTSSSVDSYLISLANVRDKMASNTYSTQKRACFGIYLVIKSRTFGVTCKTSGGSNLNQCLTFVSRQGRLIFNVVKKPFHTPKHLRTSVFRYNTASPKAPLPRVRTRVYDSSPSLPSVDTSSIIFANDASNLRSSGKSFDLDCLQIFFYKNHVKCAVRRTFPSHFMAGNSST